jgi:gamma-glutamyltranspeptidase / glutathione hydrolase
MNRPSFRLLRLQPDRGGHFGNLCCDGSEAVPDGVRGIATLSGLVGRSCRARFRRERARRGDRHEPDARGRHPVPVWLRGGPVRDRVEGRLSLRLQRLWASPRRRHSRVRPQGRGGRSYAHLWSPSRDRTWFGDLVRQARRYAHEGFVPSEAAEASIARAKERFADSPEWMAVYGRARAGDLLQQPGLARTIDMLSTDGPDALYRGQIGQALVDQVTAEGGLLSEQDLAEHQGEWVDPISVEYGGVEVLELPPNTQGIAVLEALRIVETFGGLPPDGAERHHLLMEAMKLSLADRDAYVTDPHDMRVPVEDLIADDWISNRTQGLDPRRAHVPQPGRAAVGGTAYLCAADADGMCVSLIQSNYMGFGSGLTIPDWGINLQNRGAFFSLDPGHVNAIGPRKRTLHTLIPAMALRDGRPWLVFGSMGGDGQAQTHLQLLTRIIDDGQDLQQAIDAPRWVISPEDWTVVAESRFGAGWVDDLRGRGHRISVTGEYDHTMGHAHAVLVEDHGYAGATDPRCEGAVMGL